MYIVQYCTMYTFVLIYKTLHPSSLLCMYNITDTVEQYLSLNSTPLNCCCCWTLNSTSRDDVHILDTQLLEMMMYILDTQLLEMMYILDTQLLEMMYILDTLLVGTEVCSAGSHVTASWITVT